MEERNLRKERVGIVVSDKMDKTVIVAVTEKAKHPLYKKTITRTTRFKAHDEKNECGEGDTVRIVETRRSAFVHSRIPHQSPSPQSAKDFR